MIIFFLPTLREKPPHPFKSNWEEEKNWARQEHEAEKNKEWFSPKRWLTDAEIDWATARIVKPMPGAWPDQSYKILPAWQFHLAKEAKSDALLLPELLSELTSFNGELVFIPVNQPNFHWSLLVYEVKRQVFTHYDTLGGANYGYVEPLVRELLGGIHEDKVDCEQHLVKKHDIQQGNGYDCGVAVISICQRVIERYGGDLEKLNWGIWIWLRIEQN